MWLITKHMLFYYCINKDDDCILNDRDYQTYKQHLHNDSTLCFPRLNLQLYTLQRIKALSNECLNLTGLIKGTRGVASFFQVVGP